jgi:hypothetical protein
VKVLTPNVLRLQPVADLVAQARAAGVQVRATRNKLLRDSVYFGWTLLLLRAAVPKRCFHGKLDAVGVVPKTAYRAMRVAEEFGTITGQLDEEKLYQGMKLAFPDEVGTRENFSVDRLSLRQALRVSSLNGMHVVVQRPVKNSGVQGYGQMTMAGLYDKARATKRSVNVAIAKALQRVASPDLPEGKRREIEATLDHMTRLCKDLDKLQDGRAENRVFAGDGPVSSRL